MIFVKVVLLWLSVMCCCVCCLILQEIARLLMEQEKKEYRKNREREKEKERERLAMEKMAMERRWPEGDYRVTVHSNPDFKVCFGVK